MNTIQISFHISEDTKLKSITIDFNDTDLKSDYKLLENLGYAMIKSIKDNKDDILVQDLLDDLNIKTE